MSVYDPLGSTFITGDAIVNQDGTLAQAAPQNTADATLTQQRVSKIAGLKFETAYFMHGTNINTSASVAIAKFAATLK